MGSQRENREGAMSGSGYNGPDGDSGFHGGDSGFHGHSERGRPESQTDSGFHGGDSGFHGHSESGRPESQPDSGEGFNHGDSGSGFHGGNDVGDGSGRRLDGESGRPDGHGGTVASTMMSL